MNINLRPDFNFDILVSVVKEKHFCNCKCLKLMSIEQLHSHTLLSRDPVRGCVIDSNLCV